VSSVSSALTAVAGWLVEPEREEAGVAESPISAAPRPVVAVAGLRRGAGVTTVARAVGALLAAGDDCGACLVTTSGGISAVPLGLPAAGRLARQVARVADGRARACGRLCLVEEPDPAALSLAVRDMAPLVLDVADPAGAAAAASLADHVLLVAGPDAEPSLACVVAESLGLVGPAPVIVLNRGGRAADRWAGEPHMALPESRLAAQLAGAGREPRGPLGAAVQALADRIGS
jgi:hypothetical protein